MEGQIALPLGEVFTTAGALAWGAVIAGLVQLGKKLVPMLPSGGPAVLWSVAALAAGVTALAAWDVGMALSPANIILAVLTWAGVATAAIGAYEAASLAAAKVTAGSADVTEPVG